MREAPPGGAAASAGMEIAVLGPVEVRRDGVPVDLGTPKQRALLTALALSHGQPVSVDAIIDLLWDDSAPPAATATLQAYVSGLRKVLEPGRERRAPAGVLVTVAPGYALRLPPGALDAERFDTTVTEEHRRLALPLLGPPTLPVDVLRRSVDRLDDALGLWRGSAYSELESSTGAVAERAHLDELRVVALEDRAVALLALGEHARTVADLEALTSAHPLRERLWALRALALVRSGRQAEALDVLRQVREILDEQLGLDPGAELQQLQVQVLRQDPSLAWTGPPEAVRTVTSAPEGGPAPAEAALVEPVPAPAPEADGGWPMLGRDDELAALRRALRRAGDGRTTCAVVTGDAGIGKSRLCAELVDLARRHGVRVLTGRCSQDDGAPPLWPWASVLEQLGRPMPVSEEGPGGDFRSWEAIVRSVREAAGTEPLLVVLDDLHWADTATLRVLRLLAETTQDVALLVVTTWRDHPKPTGALADLAETFARQHALRLELRGLDAPAVAGIVNAVTERRPSSEQVGALRERTDGNPFFLIEYARLAGARTELHRLLTEERPPTAVQEVLGRRLDRLPGPTVDALRGAAVVGREFDLSLLAAATGTDEDELLDLVEPAQAAGLVREDGVDRFRFAHALIRETIYAGISPSRRARRHARLASVLAGRQGHETEIARHWLAAGPAHAREAWHAAVAAAQVARRAHAHPEAAALYRSALDVLADDPAATDLDRYELLMELVTSCRWTARWNELSTCVTEALVVAERLGDPVRVAEAAMSTSKGALWQSARYGQVRQEIVDALRRSLEGLPTEDSPLRCRCMLHLAGELYYVAPFGDREALVEEALAMARRIDDPALLVDAFQLADLALWKPSTMERRLGYAEEALQLVPELDDPQTMVLCRTLRSVCLGELGRPDEMRTAVEEVRGEADRLGLAYPRLVLDNHLIGWLAMAGEFEQAEELLAGLIELSARADLDHAEDAIAGAILSIALWRGDDTGADEMVEQLLSTGFPINSTIAICLWRAGREDRAREFHAEHPPTLDDDDWFSVFNWCHTAAISLFLGDAPTAARAYERLAPLAGVSCSAGSGVASGPVDGYLAMAAAAVGETELADGHAAAAEVLAAEWQIPLFTRWLREQRDRFGF